MSVEKEYIIPESALDSIYICLLDSKERLSGGVNSINWCLNFIEVKFGYEPPKYKNQFDEQNH